jgi:ubiquinone/menaquinone biosynthesis C-methylase UbiE
MNKRTDQEYLRSDQYLDAKNLNARIDLHSRFSTNHSNWFRWVFDQFQQPADATILELGCGPGLLWNQNQDRLSENWQIHLSDFSPGMLQEASQNIQGLPQSLFLCTLDAQAIPYRSSTFDLVIANHMIYHIPDRPRAFSEIHRVLKHSGRFIAATNGLHHMEEIRDLLFRLDPDLANRTDHTFGVNEFTIENGADQLPPWFSNIQIVPFAGSLEVTEVGPLIAYILSMNAASEISISSQQIYSLQHYLEREIAIGGSFHITKSTALFIAEKNYTKAF